MATPKKKQGNVIKVGDSWMTLAEANKKVKSGELNAKNVLKSWNSRLEDRQNAPDDIKAEQGWDTKQYAKNLVERRIALNDPLLSNEELVRAFPQHNKETTAREAHNQDNRRKDRLEAARKELTDGTYDPAYSSEGAVGPDGKRSGPIEVPLQTMESVSSGDVLPWTGERDASYMPPPSELEPLGGFHSAPPTDAVEDPNQRNLNRQVFASELRDALGGKTEGQMYSVMTDDMQSKADKLGLSAGQVSSFLKKEFGKQEADRKEKDRLARYNEFYDRTTGAGSGLAGRKRKMYARNAGLNRAIQLRKKGFGSAAERLALGAASSLEAQGPAVASQGYLQALEDNKAQANRQRAINQQLGVKLLAGLQNI